MKYTCPRRCGCDPMKGLRHGKGNIYYAYGERWYGLQALFDSGLTGCSGTEMISARMVQKKCISVTTEQLRKEQVARQQGKSPKWGWRSWEPEIAPELYQKLLNMPAFGEANIPQERFTRL